MLPNISFEEKKHAQSKCSYLTQGTLKKKCITRTNNQIVYLLYMIANCIAYRQRDMRELRTSANER